MSQLLEVIPKSSYLHVSAKAGVDNRHIRSLIIINPPHHWYTSRPSSIHHSYINFLGGSVTIHVI